jgi:hypothetical protein
MKTPYLVLLHRFGMFEDENDPDSTAIGGGIRIDLFLIREFGNLMNEPQEDRIEVWNSCRRLVRDLKDEYGIQKLWFCPNFEFKE